MPKKQGKVTVAAATSPQLGLLKFYAFLLNAIKVLFTILLLLFCYNNMKDKTPKRKAVYPKIIIKIGPNSRSKSTHRIEKQSSSEITKESPAIGTTASSADAITRRNVFTQKL